MHNKGSDIIFISTGIMTEKCIEIAKMFKSTNIKIGIVHCPTIQPLNFNEILKVIKKIQKLYLHLKIIISLEVLDH